ncbi:MAG: type II toxin-antitoxin system VapC family toxin [Pyrinomonadaceae bacterium]
MAKTTRVLIDTHVFLWIFLEPHRIPETVKRFIQNKTEIEILFSYISSWEISIKYGSNKLSIPEPPDEFVPERVAKAGFTHLPILLAHVLGVHKLPPFHKDPFDRLLISQAKAEKIPILTVDPRFAVYDIETISFLDLN